MTKDNQKQTILNSGKQIEEIRQGLAYVESHISIGSKTNLTDPNIHAEDFVGGLLNILFDFDLVNANIPKANSPCIDLIDISSGIGVQVTSENTSSKILKTIECLEKHAFVDTINTLKIFTLKPKQKKYTINKSCRGIKFDWKDDIIDFKDIMEAIVHIKKRKKLTQIHSLVISFTTIFTDYSTSIPSLYLPRKEANPSWLSFSARSTELVGRSNELKFLKNFLESEKQFSWWLITGPAGTGKSRLALELCNLFKEQGWYVGFLQRSNKVFDWARYRPIKKTLIVVDYVMGRTQEVSDLILELSYANKTDNTTRILLLERESQSWWSNFIREDSLSENAEIVNSKYPYPELKLSNLSESDMLVMARQLSLARHSNWDKTNEEKLLKWMRRHNISGRPLYVMLFSEFPNVDEPSELLRIVLRKESIRRKEQIHGNLLNKHENLLFLATIVGGILPENGGFDQLNSAVNSGLLPKIGEIDFDNYFSMIGVYNESAAIPGITPDLIGELHVLDGLSIEGVKGLHNNTLLKLAYKIQPDDVIAFVTRCYFDFSDHPSLKKLFNLPLDSTESRLTKAKLITQFACFPAIIFDKFLQSEVDEITLIGDSYVQESELKKWVSLSEYNYACSLIFPKFSPFILTILGVNAEERINEAKKRLRAVATRVKENSPIRFMALLNLATLLENSNDAVDIYKEVIESKAADEETRACALNNRAYIYQGRKNDLAAIKDREQVLALSNTSPDRRFVALFGCGESHFSLGMYDEVVQDMTTIIESVDIIQIDKLCALIIRSVGLYFKEGLQASSLNDLELAAKKLIGFIKDEDLQLELSKSFRLKEWPKSIELIENNKNNSKDDATELLMAAYPLLTTFSPVSDNVLEKDKWDELRKLTISKARRMRVHNHNIPI